MLWLDLIPYILIYSNIEYVKGITNAEGAQETLIAADPTGLSSLPSTIEAAAQGDERAQGQLAAGVVLAVGVKKVGGGKRSPGLGNQFKNKTVKQVNAAMEKHVNTGKLDKKYTDPVSGSTSYKNTQSGYSYNVDTGKSGRTGGKVEPSHIDVNYPNPKPKNVPNKEKLPIKNQ